MKRILLAVAMLLPCFLIAEEVYDYQRLSWGMTMEEVKSRSFLCDPESIVDDMEMHRISSKIKFLGSPGKEIYGFIGGKLAQVEIRADQVNWLSVSNYLVSTCGKPSRMESAKSNSYGPFGMALRNMGVWLKERTMVVVINLGREWGASNSISVAYICSTNEMIRQKIFRKNK